jgi:CspA family cold shock protein
MEKGIIDGLMDKGFGFIKREGHEKNLFFHAKELQGVDFDSLKVGDEMQFEVNEGPKGPQASNVSKA